MAGSELTRSDVNLLAGAASAMLKAVCSNENELDDFFMMNGVVLSSTENALIPRAMDMFDQARQNGEDMLRLFGGLYRDISRDGRIFNLEQCNNLFHKFDSVLKRLDLMYVPGGDIIPKVDNRIGDIASIATDTILGEDSPVSIPAELTSSVQRMCTAYLRLYILETTLRDFIARASTELTFPPKLSSKIETNKQKDDRWGWIEKRIGSDLIYLDLKELPSVVENNWHDFSQRLPERSWLRTHLDDMIQIRNRVMHCSEITTDEYDTLRVDFVRLMRALKYGDQ